MNKFKLGGYIDQKCLLPAFFVLFFLFISGNVITQKKWTKDYVMVVWIPEKNCIDISVMVYEYLFEQNSNFNNKHAFLKFCRVEASVNNSGYYQVLDLMAERQVHETETIVFSNNKGKGFKIEFRNARYVSMEHQKIWSDDNPVSLFVPNFNNKAVIRFRWHLEGLQTKVRYIKLSGKWVSKRNNNQEFKNIIYEKRILSSMICNHCSH